MYQRLTIKITKFKDKYKVSFIDNHWDKNGYFFLDKMFNFDEFDQKVFDNEFTYTIQCFAMALYIDKKIELCLRRKYDLTPDCFKKAVDKE